MSVATRERVPVDVLVVDDDPRKLAALEAILSATGENVVKASSGPEALKWLLRRDFAVILLDVNMPGMDGFETAALIRQRPRSAHTPIIFFTAFGDDTHAARGYSLGAVDYINPVMPAVLRTKVGVFVELFRKSEELRRQSQFLEQRAAQLRRLTQASLAISAAASVASIVHILADQARDVLHAHQASGYVAVDEEHTHCATSMSPECAALPAQLREPGPTVGERVRAANQSLRMARDDPDEGTPAILRGRIATPLAVRGRNLGFLEVRGKLVGDFTQEDGDVLLQLAHMGTIAVDNILHTEERETNRLKDEFLATVSHELRTPLSAILTWARILDRDDLDAATRARGVKIINRNAKAQAQLIGDLLDVSRVITGKLHLDLRAVDLRMVVGGAIDSLAPAAEAKAIEITAHVPPEPVPLVGDPERLQQVLWNLMGNAIKFTPEGGRVDVRLDRTEQHVEIIVTDTGQGISPAFLPQVFDRFRQADSSTSRAHGGLGLGLAIVRNLTELHGGSVRAESPGEGRGATFTVTLPFTRVVELGPRAAAISFAPHRAIAGEASDVAPQLDGLRALVIDDDADGREAIAIMLTRAGAEVSTAASVRSALTSIDHWLPDVVVSDIGLPGEDGYVFIEQLRTLAAERGLSIPAVALTAYAGAEERARALSAGYLEHLAKPVEPTRLLSVLAAFRPAEGCRELRPVSAPRLA